MTRLSDYLFLQPGVSALFVVSLLWTTYFVHCLPIKETPPNQVTVYQLLLRLVPMRLGQIQLENASLLMMMNPPCCLAADGNSLKRSDVPVQPSALDSRGFCYCLWPRDVRLYPERRWSCDAHKTANTNGNGISFPQKWCIVSYGIGGEDMSPQRHLVNRFNPTGSIWS